MHPRPIAETSSSDFPSLRRSITDFLPESSRIDCSTRRSLGDVAREARHAAQGEGLPGGRYVRGVRIVSAFPASVDLDHRLTTEEHEYRAVRAVGVVAVVDRPAGLPQAALDLVVS